MQPDNFENILRVFKKRTPFKPFTVALVNGDKFEVDFPDALNFRDGVAVFLGPGGVPWIFDYEGVSEFIDDLMGHEKEPAG